MKKIYGTLLVVIAILFLISMALQVAPIIMSIALGLSMFPTVRSGDLLICVHKNFMPITNGSIASYTNGWTSVVHRVVDIKGDIYVFRGDNNILNEYIPSQNVVCRVVGIIPIYIWVPTISLMFSLCIVYATRKSSRYAYSILSIIIAFMVLIPVVSFSNLAVMFTDTYIVKPNPLPIIIDINKRDSVLEIEFSTELNGYVSCLSASNTTLSCHIERNKVVIEELYSQMVRIMYKPYTPYNISVVYEFATGG